MLKNFQLQLMHAPDDGADAPITIGSVPGRSGISLSAINNTVRQSDMAAMNGSARASAGTTIATMTENSSEPEERPLGGWQQEIAPGVVRLTQEEPKIQKPTTTDRGVVVVAATMPESAQEEAPQQAAAGTETDESDPLADSNSAAPAAAAPVDLAAALKSGDRPSILREIAKLTGGDVEALAAAASAFGVAAPTKAEAATATAQAQNAQQEAPAAFNEEALRQQRFFQVIRESGLRVGAPANRPDGSPYSQHDIASMAYHHMFPSEKSKGIAPSFYPVTADMDPADRQMAELHNEQIRANIIAIRASVESFVDRERARIEGESRRKSLKELEDNAALERNWSVTMDEYKKLQAKFPRLANPLANNMAISRIRSVFSDSAKYPPEKYPTPEHIVKEALRQLRQEDTGEGRLGIFDAKAVDGSARTSTSQKSTAKAQTTIGSQALPATGTPRPTTRKPQSWRDIPAHEQEMHRQAGARERPGPR